MSEADNDKAKEIAAEIKKERTRLWRMILESRDSMTAEYKALIRHTGGLVTNSMTYAYSKGINDVMKLILKENNEDESV